MYAEHDMDMALTEYADHLRADYGRWLGEEGVIRYDVEFKRGQKFIKVINKDSGGGRSVHSFVCVKAHDKWAVGDILKAAGWAQPAKNFARGNVLRQDWSATRWTGA
jgi:hypothetical protein